MQQVNVVRMVVEILHRNRVDEETLFKKADSDGDGFIGRKELKLALDNLLTENELPFKLAVEFLVQIDKTFKEKSFSLVQLKQFLTGDNLESSNLLGN